jgi:hypothetical protein
LRPLRSPLFKNEQVVKSRAIIYALKNKEVDQWPGYSIISQEPTSNRAIAKKHTAKSNLKYIHFP